MLLAIDIGNTNTVAGVYDNDELRNHFRVASNHKLTVDECGFFVTGLVERMQISCSEINRVIIASVVPALTPVYSKMAEKYFSVEPVVVSAEIDLPIKLDYADPKEIGADRIANAVAAFAQFGGPTIVVDFGTSTNFDVVTVEGIYLGGVIAPGAETSGENLAKKAARLFKVAIEKPDKAIGRSTAEAIKSGLFHGTIGQVDYIVSLIIEELGSQPKVIATGGLAPELAGHSKYISSICPTLTLDGLKLIAASQS